MEEVLFHGKRKDNGEWVEGFLFKTQEHTYIAYAKQFDDDLFISPKNIFIEVIPETVGQYTGLTDKNGKKIFDGDICSSGKNIYEIVWDENMHGFYCKVLRSECCLITTRMLFPLWHWDGCAENNNQSLEDVGNIHDNSEALK